MKYVVRPKPTYFQIPGYDVSAEESVVDDKEHRKPAAHRTRRFLFPDSNIQIKPC